MSSSVIENSTSNVEKTNESPETTAPQVSTTNTSPWETLDHQPGALKTKAGNKLLTIEDALKKNGTNNSSTKTQNHSFKQSKIEQVSIPVKKEDEEQWNPVDLTHLLITDAPPRSSKNGNGRFKNGNNGSKRRSDNSSKSDRNRSSNNNKREGKEKLPHGENKKQSESGDYKKNSSSSSSNFSKSNNYNNKESNSFRKNKSQTPKLNVSDEKKPLTEDSKAKEENKKAENVVKSSEPVEQVKKEEKKEEEEQEQVTKESKDGETNKESEPKQFNGEYQPRFPSNYKSKKPYTEGSSSRYPRKPFNPNHKHYSNDHYNSENKKPYEKRPYQPRTYNNRYNNSYQNRSYSNSQQPIILPIYQKQFPYEVYHECAKQLAYYLSVDNLEKDEFMVKNLIDKNGYVQLSQLLNFKKLKQLSENGNFEIVMTAIFIILSQQLDEPNDVEVALLDSMSEYIATDVYGNKNPYDCYILRNLKWVNKDFESNPRVFNPVTAFGVNDFISYSIQKPIVLEQEKEEEKKIEETQE